MSGPATSSVRASKTWILPPRAKPGRKSKQQEGTSSAAAIAIDNNDDSADLNKTAASRTKQKASRERKQEYLAELEAKLRTYEQGDGERASFFQNLAKRYSSENEALKIENKRLRQCLADVQALDSLSVPNTSTLLRKPSLDLPKNPKRQRTRSSSIASASTSSSMSAGTPKVSASSIPSDNNDGRVTPTQAHGVFQSSQSQMPKSSYPFQSQFNTTSLTPATLPSAYMPPSPSTSSALSPIPPHTSTDHVATPGESDDGCGLCDRTASTQCICEDIGIASSRTPSGGAMKVYPRKASCGLCDESRDDNCLCEDIGLGRPESIDDDGDRPALTNSGGAASTASLPLKHHTGNSKSGRGMIWRLDEAGPALVQHQPRNTASAAGVALRRRLIKVGSRLPCSGDPSSCPACAGDPAGQAFCSALSSTVCSTNPCATCPNRPSPLSNEVKRSRASTPADGFDIAAHILLRQRDSSARDEVPASMIGCSDAWATLREHPNIGFANLNLLASVIARRTTCLGDQQDNSGKIVEVGREGIEEALDILDHVRE
ncbi:MAG: hypothetical protein CYPHOPRED_005966 [Cyphobasidiales sp. Tagirdzhanova-0007]|nr:MAG: hypothetical protein CYPHOPRED_005966 [Cyphobasidiales sp. Tagirdzhanova-0007]